MTDIVERIEEAFRHDTFWDTDAPPLLSDAVAEIKRLREAIRLIADQYATLTVQGCNVIVTMDATLTDEELEAIEVAVLAMPTPDVYHLSPPAKSTAAILRNLLERLK